ncbi:hypothetical protein JJB07_05120 [Tumebacillus sp. ITR2]|uniref:LXG domain-containing protein n=1 Tax=Tumebacillus amylolyticus TaxID=2801339 RepID=A0ABS1J6Y1_9BACL|nr:hypothetical protein [Tumebacillus amylolyticus]MBL0386028.1 hypothetical protein [Tumebacillus amylolyticus]
MKGLQAQTLEGAFAWKGSAALKFAAVSDLMYEDLRTAGTIFERIAGTLNTLAAQLDQVNHLIQQSESLQGEINHLHHCINSTDDPNQKASYRSELQYYLNRRAALIAESEEIERRANKSAEDDFADLGNMVENLHCFRSYDGHIVIDPEAPITGLSKGIGNAGAILDGEKSITNGLNGFGVYRVRSASRDYILVKNGHLEGIQGTRYYLSNAQNYPQVMKFADPKVATVEAMKDLKGWGTRLGYLSIAYETGDHLIENIQEGKSTSHIVAEATVDVAVGTVSMATATYTGAVVGTMIGGPLGTIVGAAVGGITGYLLSQVTDGTYVEGKSIGDHLKDSLEEGIDAVGNLTKCGWDATCHVFD